MLPFGFEVKAKSGKTCMLAVMEKLEMPISEKQRNYFLKA
jgi:hypothetical protein